MQKTVSHFKELPGPNIKCQGWETLLQSYQTNSLLVSEHTRLSHMLLCLNTFLYLECLALPSLSRKLPFPIQDPTQMSPPLHCPSQIPQSWMFLFLCLQSFCYIPCYNTLTILPQDEGLGECIPWENMCPTISLIHKAQNLQPLMPVYKFKRWINKYEAVYSV